MKEKFLPIGTIVLLKNGKKEVMITSYGIMPQGDIIENGKQVPGQNKMFDYGACTYPEGFVNPENMIAFDHDKIERVCYMGYETDEFKAFNDIIKKAFPALKKKMEEEAKNK